MEKDPKPASRIASSQTASRPIPASSFQDRFLALNRADGFKTWTFYRGMLFLSHEKWWGSGGPRSTPHEGIDLCFYSDQEDEHFTVKAGMKVPSPYSGSVVKIVPDFIAQSVFLRHGEIAKAGAHLFTMFGHVDPEPGLQLRSDIKDGRVLATIADASTRHNSVPSHLHISQAWIDDSMPLDAITWERIMDKRIALIDPLKALRLTHVIEETHS